ncbi:anti-anti-sigma factor [Mycolicibacterium litorale]|uniref:Anti-anti-sigma factor n=1 Tax=Mycolicibacterium litorale TaxID=758802 RepID=A0A6S6NY04_9MYCO|nr:STAS domain-containing protein [Mycolicibacterium litorale]BCI51009.1 anti-anti-sigma factor [Mycolicibacterium litorale]
MTTPLSLDRTQRDDGTQVLTVAGEIDLSNIDTFRQAITAATADAARTAGALTVDVSAVEYLDSAAISVLYDRADDIQRLIAHDLLMSSLTVSGVTELVATEVVPSASDA